VAEFMHKDENAQNNDECRRATNEFRNCSEQGMAPGSE
jgi:hypothetical protein